MPKRTPSTLELAVQQLILTQATAQAQIAKADERMARADERMMALEERIVKLQEENREIFATIVRLLENLPDALRAAIGFAPGQA